MCALELVDVKEKVTYTQAVFFTEVLSQGFPYFKWAIDTLRGPCIFLYTASIKTIC